MALSQAELDAIDRLQNFYNGNPYDAVTNAGGLADGGHRENEIDMMQDVALVGDASAREAQAAADVVAATSLSSTSSTSLTIGTGSKSLTVETGKGYIAGQHVKIAETANPTINYMVGVVTSYNSGTGALVVDVTAAYGSGTITSWSISYSQNPIKEVFESDAITGAILDGDYVIGITNLQTELISFGFEVGLGSLDIQLFLSPDRTSASGTSITGGTYTGVSTTFDQNALTGNNTTTAGSRRYLIAKVTNASGAQDLFYESVHTRKVEV